MKIIIPTYKRVKDQITLSNLPEVMHPHVRFIVNAEEAPRMRKLYTSTGAQVIVHPEDITSIAKKRAWILKQEKWDKMVMLDDDLRFFIKRTDEGMPEKLRRMNAQETVWGFKQLRKKLDKYVHVGCATRLGSHLKETGWVENTRAIYVLGYRASVIREKCALGRIEGREDMELTLQLLKKGYPNAVFNDMACEQYAYNSEGGASGEGRIKFSNEQAMKFAELHPGFVTLVKRDYKVSTPRWEVQVAWQKAFQSSQKKGLLR